MLPDFHGEYPPNKSSALSPKDIRTNGEFYVAPAYNELINQGMRVGIFNIGSEFEGMYGLGIPEDLKKFLKHPLSEKYKSVIRRNLESAKFWEDNDQILYKRNTYKKEDVIAVDTIKPQIHKNLFVST